MKIGTILKSCGLTIVLALSGMGVGCSGGGGQEDTAPDLSDVLAEYKPDAIPESGDWLMLHLPAEMPHLNPLTSSDYYASTVLAWVFDTLLDRDPATLDNLPMAAASWEISEDHLTYTFHLRNDIRFSDGVPLTAHDVKFTYDKLMDPSIDAPHLRSYFVDVVACEVLDDFTVRFSCSKPYYRHLVMIGGMSILPRHLFAEGDFNNHPNNRNPIGSGMYMIERWETGRQLVLTRNPHYEGRCPKGRPYFDKIIYSIILDDNAAFQVLSRGDLDFISMNPELFVRRANTPRFRERFNRFSYFRPAYNYVGWNLRKPLFRDKETRTALTLLMDRELIRDRIYYGQALVIHGNFMPGSPEHHDGISPLPFDPDRARKLLAQAGWADTNGDGLLDREGVPFRFETLLTIQNPVAEKILTVYKEELARVGIELIIRPMEWASLLERVDKREFDSILMGWSMPPDPDPHQVWHSSQSEAGSNYIGFINEESDVLIEAARTEFDRDKRISLYRRFQEILHEEQPYLFLLAPKVLAAGDKRIEGIRMYPFGLDQRDWFVPTPLQRYGK